MKIPIILLFIPFLSFGQILKKIVKDKFDIRYLEKGTYILNLSDGINTLTRKIIKE